MVKRIGVWVLVLGMALALCVGCAAVQYRNIYADYEARVQQLKDMGGEEEAPYETAKAENYLKTMKKEMDERDWKGAEVFQEKLDQYLELGMQKVQ